MKQNKKQLKQNYQQSPRAMGVFLIRNNLSDKVFLDSGLDLHGIINRHKFQLNNGIHPNKSLQDHWKQLGSKAFAFEIVDELAPREGAEFDYRKELSSLEDLWLEKLRPFGDRGYNLPKLSKEAKLRRMAAKRLKDS
ncbi:MAG TPA: GIY-YIG nuclease family protein [Pyrinomonadaceae bacterium]|jgi:hypothetical protein